MDFSIFYKFFFYLFIMLQYLKYWSIETYREYGSSNWKKEYLKTYMIFLVGNFSGKHSN